MEVSVNDRPGFVEMVLKNLAAHPLGQLRRPEALPEAWFLLVPHGVRAPFDQKTATGM
jgi:hypothetical protein